MLSLQLFGFVCTVGPPGIQRMTESVLPLVVKSSRRRKLQGTQQRDSTGLLQSVLNDGHMTISLFSPLIVRCIARLQKEVFVATKNISQKSHETVFHAWTWGCLSCRSLFFFLSLLLSLFSCLWVKLMHQRLLKMTRHTAGNTGYHSHHSHTIERTSLCVWTSTINFRFKVLVGTFGPQWS